MCQQNLRSARKSLASPIKFNKHTAADDVQVWFLQKLL